MVIYEREKKTLIIPTGLGNLNYGGESYEQGVSDGKAEQAAADRARLTTKDITENGSYEAPYGYSRVNVNVPTSGGGDCSEAIATAYESGHTAGVQETKAGMVSTAITANGTYERVDGYNEVSVNVPKEVRLASLVQAPVPAELEYDYFIRNFNTTGSQFDGWGRVELDMKNIINYGKDEQKALLGSQSFSANGTYTTSGNGWSSVTIGVYSEDCQEAYDNGFSDGYATGYANSRNDMTEITPASSVTLTEYGTYYFTYDENTDIQSMLVNFAHTQPQPPHSGSTSGYGGFVRIQSFGRRDLNDFPLYNENADDSTLSGILINGEEFTGGSRYTGSASQITYYFEGQIPDNFWSGWSVDGMGFYAEMHFESMLIGKNAFKNANIDRATIFTNKECIIDEGAFENTTIWSIHLMQYRSGGTFTFNHNSFKDNPAFKRLRTYMRSMVINGDSSLFANSKADGTAIIDSRVPLNDIYATQWWSTLENQGWTAENS